MSGPRLPRAAASSSHSRFTVFRPMALGQAWCPSSQERPSFSGLITGPARCGQHADFLEGAGMARAPEKPILFNQENF